MSRKMVVSLFLICFITPLISAYLFIQSNWSPNTTVNNGLLVTENIIITDWHTPERRLWSIAIMAPNGCLGMCVATIESVNKVHLALGKHNEHVGVVLLSETEAAFNNTEVVKTQLNRLSEDSIYLVDHMGLIVLEYPLSNDISEEIVFKGLLTDIKKLLKYARSS